MNFGQSQAKRYKNEVLGKKEGPGFGSRPGTFVKLFLLPVSSEQETA